MMIGDGSKLQITHTGSTTLNSPHKSFLLDNVLCVPSMKRNLISIYQFCNSNNASIEFLLDTFLVKEFSTGTTLLKGQAKGGVYEWPDSTPIISFSSITTSSSNWHHRLGHPTIPILKQILSSNKLSVTSSMLSDVNYNACLSNTSHKLSFSNSTISSSHTLEIIYTDV